MKHFSVIIIILFSLVMLVALFRFRVSFLIAYIIAINVSSFTLYGIDKLSALYQWQRVPEKLLHFLALSGGSPMALLAQYLFNHKTSKRRFLIAYWVIVALQAALIYAVFYTDLLMWLF